MLRSELSFRIYSRLADAEAPFPALSSSLPIKLRSNPENGNSSDSYVETHPKTAKKKYYSEPLKDYKFSDEDMSIIRHLIKKYKKSTTRHKKRK